MTRQNTSIKLEEAVKKLQRRKKSSVFRLAQGDEEDEANAEENSVPYKKHREVL